MYRLILDPLFSLRSFRNARSPFPPSEHDLGSDGEKEETGSNCYPMAKMKIAVNVNFNSKYPKQATRLGNQLKSEFACHGRSPDRRFY